MSDILMQILIAVTISVIGGLIYNLIKKFNDRELEQRKIIYESLLALLIAVKSGHVNGEIEDALKKLKDFIIKN